MMSTVMTRTQKAAYKARVDKVVERCVRTPRTNWTLFECVVEEVHGGGPPPTDAQARIIEDAVHRSRSRVHHARIVPPDQEAADELELFIVNDADLYRQQHVPILKNLATKKVRSQYEHDLAVKMFGYLVESGAKKYADEHGSPGQPWHKLFDVPTRRLVAENLARDFETEFELGNYDHLLPAKYQREMVTGQVRFPRGHATKSRSAAQLDRDISEVVPSWQRAGRSSTTTRRRSRAAGRGA